MSPDQKHLDIDLSGAALTDEDIYEAMRRVPGYLDITAADFKELYAIAYRHAIERLAKSLRAADIMTREVISVAPDTPLEEVAEIMGKRGISGLPVADAAGRVVGVISEKDFLARLGAEKLDNFMTMVARCLKARGCITLSMRADRAEDIMSSPAVTVREETPYAELVGLLSAGGINRVPVIDAENRLVGIVSRGDIIRASRALSCHIDNS